MNNLLKYSAIATPLILLLAVSVWFMPADEAKAAEGCGPCGPYEYGPTVTGTSTADCYWAEQEALINARASADCGPEYARCSAVTAELVMACDPQGPVPYIATARSKFRCKHCEEIDPRLP